MKTRYKIFSEFLKQAKVGYANNEVVIVCKNNVLYKGQRPWNSPETKKSFLAKLYIKYVLQRKDISSKIQRIEGYELLGKRYNYKSNITIVCATEEVVDPDGGEVLIMTTSIAEHRTQPFKILLRELEKK